MHSSSLRLLDVVRIGCKRKRLELSMTEAEADGQLTIPCCLCTSEVSHDTSIPNLDHLRERLTQKHRGYVTKILLPQPKIRIKGLIFATD